MDVLDVARISQAVANVQESVKFSRSHIGQASQEKFRNNNLCNKRKESTSEDMWKRSTWAQYNEGQVTLAMRQPRDRLKSIMTGVFCLEEQGKWKVSSLPRTATRKYLLRKQLRENQQYRRTLRDLITARLRKEISRGLTHIRTTKLIDLVRQASYLQEAGQITADAGTPHARIVLECRNKAEASAETLQCLIRGVNSRHFHNIQRPAVIENLNKRQQIHYNCLWASVNIVKCCIHIALDRALRGHTTPAHISSRRLDGDHCFFLIYSPGNRTHDVSCSRPPSDSPPLCGHNFSYRVVAPIFGRESLQGPMDHHEHAPISEQDKGRQPGRYAVCSRPWRKLLVTCYNTTAKRTSAREIYEHDLKVELGQSTVGRHLLYQGTKTCSLLKSGPVVTDDDEALLKNRLSFAAQHRLVCHISWIKTIIAAALAADRQEASHVHLETIFMAREEMAMRR